MGWWADQRTKAAEAARDRATAKHLHGLKAILHLTKRLKRQKPVVEAALAYVSALERQDADHRADRKQDKPWVIQARQALVDAAKELRGVAQHGSAAG